MRDLCEQHCVVQVFAWMKVMVVMFMDLPEKSCLGDQQGLKEPLCCSFSTTSIKTCTNKDQTSVQRSQPHDPKRKLQKNLLNTEKTILKLRINNS